MARSLLHVHQLRRLVGILLLGIGTLVIGTRGLDAIRGPRAGLYARHRDERGLLIRDLTLGGCGLAAGAALLLTARRDRRDA